MMEYSVKDLCKALAGKWYVIAGVALLVGLGSIPLAQKAYEQAYGNYLQLLAAPENDQSAEEAVRPAFCIWTVKSAGQWEGSDAEAADMLNQFLHQASVREIINGKLHKEEIVETASSFQECTITLLGESNLLLLGTTSLTQSAFQMLTDRLMEILDKDFHMMDRQITIHKGHIISGEFGDNEATHNQFVEAVIKEPVRRENYIQMMITAGALGCLFGVVIVLIIIYREGNRHYERNVTE